MYADISKPPKALPQPNPQEIRPGLTLQTPLLRSRENGPGIITLVPDVVDKARTHLDGVPSLLIKWAEEGYVVAEIQASALAADQEVLRHAVAALQQCEKCESTERIGLIVYDHTLLAKLSQIASIPEIAGAIVYTDSTTSLQPLSVPTLLHVAGAPPAQPDASAQRPAQDRRYYYPTVKSSSFATPFTADFHYNSEAVSHTRSLTFLKPKVNGPYFDLETIWDEHTYYEFADRSVQHTMSTMVQEPYVNHVPTLTGGVGREPLSNFYRDSFIFSNSADTELELISRTVGIDRVIDEFIFKFTHTQEIPWMLPGVPATNLPLQLPFTAVVNIRGDRLYHEHISWDQGTALKQLGLLPDYMPFPYPVPGVVGGTKTEYRLPITGLDTARKIRDRNSVPSNDMIIGYKVRPSGAGVES
ncbi:carboxymethylenebutenolidase [Exophiala aquamarina CBS 119918]|uniref:Carboxymethylenebutenolidase n=1 Tax=Exophiala aquamarina CBS 119918 TaxID=1182545 RepID=A0A072PJ15_9EURO|nr:carboxymethylenebutenolidase [Exophiala aquamarina CBS 119918]KEF60124.1 carboxymethylenebutenolidase [Exophiala aquamarina CBS 119918]